MARNAHRNKAGCLLWVATSQLLQILKRSLPSQCRFDGEQAAPEAMIRVGLGVRGIKESQKPVRGRTGRLRPVAGS